MSATNYAAGAIRAAEGFAWPKYGNANKRQPAYARAFWRDRALAGGARLWICGPDALGAAGREVDAGARTSLALVDDSPDAIDWSLLAGCDVTVIQRAEPLQWSAYDLVVALLRAGAGRIAVVTAEGFVQDAFGRDLYADGRAVP